MPAAHRPRPLPVLLTLLSLALSAPAALRADEASDQYNLAVGLYRQERWEQAAEAFAAFAKDFPTNAKASSATFYRGLALINAQKFDDARTTLRGFVQNYPKAAELPAAMYRVAESSYLLDDLKSAEAEFDAFLGKYPDHQLGEWSLPYLGDVQLRLGKSAAAAKTFQQSLDKFPKGRMSEDSRFGLARAYEALGQPAAALREYQRLAADPKSPFAARSQMNIGVAHFDAEEYPEAAEAFEQVVRAFPDSPQAPSARMNAGYAWYRVGDFRKAIEKFTQAAQDPNQAAAAGYWTGISHKGLGDYDRAITVFKQTLDAHPDDPQAQQALYQWADTELLAGNYEGARGLFLDVVRRWPQGELADDSLHFAAEAALLQSADPQARPAALQAAEELLTRFEKDYPRSDLQMPHLVLRGRLLDAKGSPAERDQAVALFRRVLQESKVPRTQSQARYHLGRTLQKAGDHQHAVEVFAPLLDEIRKTGPNSEFFPALVLTGQSLLQIQKHDEAVRTLTDYLELKPGGAQADQALALRAVAHARRNDKEQVRLDLKTLEDKFASSPLLPEKLHEIAEWAYDAGDYAWSAELFDRLVKVGPQSKFYLAGLSGHAWSLQQQKQYDAAAAAFARAAQELPVGDERLGEAMYMQGQALQDARRPKDAIAAFEAAFTRFAPAQPAPTGAEDQRPTRFAYLSGLQTARAHKQLGDTAAADAAYQRLLEKFPKPARADHLLDEWALLHYEAQNYEQADALFTRIVNEFPASDRADDARLNLAESDFIAGRIDQARQAFQTLHADDKADPPLRRRALYQLIELESEQARWQEVVRLVADFRRQFPDEKYADDVTFRLAEAQLALGDVKQAAALLTGLKSAVTDPASGTAPRWAGRVWVLLAESQIRQKDYDAVARTVAELGQKAPQSPALSMAYEVLGRSYKNRPMPDFEQARVAFLKALEDPALRGTETAAKAQLMVAETYYLQKDYTRAQTAYLKVYHLYDLPDWQAPALLQVAACDEQLGQWPQAVRSYEELLEKFPKSDAAAKAQERLKAARQRAAGQAKAG